MADTGSTSGTVATGGVATQTLGELRQQIRLLLASSADWTNANLDVFIQDAIRFYSAQMPLRARYSLSLTTDTQAYDLPGGHGFLGILSVEYPTGQSPQSFLREVNEWDDAFQDEEDVYCIRGIDDQTAIEDYSAIGQIVFAETVATGETAIIEYHAVHQVPLGQDDDAYITVPVAHWEALIAFVDFRCHWELESDLAATVTNVSIVLAQLGQEGRRAWNRYKEIMNVLVMGASRSVNVPWSSQDDSMKRVY
jgi:hypothetical protein